MTVDPGHFFISGSETKFTRKCRRKNEKTRGWIDTLPSAFIWFTTAASLNAARGFLQGLDKVIFQTLVKSPDTGIRKMSCLTGSSCTTAYHRLAAVSEMIADYHDSGASVQNKSG